MQDFLDSIDDTTGRQMIKYSERLGKKFPPNIAEDIAREMLMYNS
jgi:hypothetical protein